MKADQFDDNVNLACLELLEVIQNQHSCRYFVWPDEGHIVEGVFFFNGKHEGFEPLLIDPTTAHAMVSVYEALKPTNRTTFRDMVAKDRGTFAAMLEFCWSKVAPKQRTLSQV